MAITAQQISDVINKAEQRVALNITEVVNLGGKGRCDGLHKIYLETDYLSASMDALNNPNDLTNSEKEKIVNCMNSVGKLNELTVI